MSGGHYYYKYKELNELAQLISEDLKDEEFKQYKFSDKTIRNIKGIFQIIKMAGSFAHSLEWLMSGDTGEDTFNKEVDEATLEYFKNLLT